MTYSEGPNSGTYKNSPKKLIPFISLEKILGNEKLVLSLMFSGMAAVLITWAIRKD